MYPDEKVLILNRIEGRMIDEPVFDPSASA